VGNAAPPVYESCQTFLTFQVLSEGPRDLTRNLWPDLNCNPVELWKWEQFFVHLLVFEAAQLKREVSDSSSANVRSHRIGGVDVHGSVHSTQIDVSPASVNTADPHVYERGHFPRCSKFFPHVFWKPRVRAVVRLI